MSEFNYDASHFTNANTEQRLARQQILSLASEKLAFEDEFFRDLPLFTHSGIVARSQAIHDLYMNVRNLPGLFLDFGTWKGSNMVLLENFRAIYDNFDAQRKIIGFDTFSGYEGFLENESQDSTIQNQTYSLDLEYSSYLQNLLSLHEIANGKRTAIHRVVVGNAVVKLPEILNDEVGTPIALALFDMNAFEPTFEVLKQLIPRISTGTFLTFWQFTRPQISGERRALYEVKDLLPKFKLHKSQTYPSMVHCEIL